MMVCSFYTYQLKTNKNKNTFNNSYTQILGVGKTILLGVTIFRDEEEIIHIIIQ